VTVEQTCQTAAFGNHPQALSDNTDRRVGMSSISQQGKPPTRIPEHIVLEALGRLVKSKALNSFQAEWLAINWDSLPDDWTADPCFRSIPEHTRLYIELLHHALSER
jgi:hypothetical protein